MSKGGKFIPWMVVIIALFLLIVHLLKWEKIQVDAITLSLLGILLAIPLIDYVRKIKIGSFEAEIDPREIKEAKVTASSDIPASDDVDIKSESYVELIDLVNQDIQLGLAKLRIELEQLLKTLYRLSESGESDYRKLSLTRIVESLRRNEILPPSLANSLRDVISIANRAVHGESIRESDAEEIAIVGVQLLERLRLIYLDKISKPIETHIIDKTEVDRSTHMKYRVTTIIPLVDNPKRNVYEFDQDDLDEFLKGYAEYAEFLIEIKPSTQCL